MQQANILVVDDEAPIRDMITMALEVAGYRCMQAANAQDAHSLIIDERPDLVLMDWMMPGTDITLLGDATQLQSAISNLMFNAVKHNPHGGTIKIDTACNGRGINVTVTDDGIGIDPIHLPRLTERFYRVDSSRATSTGGTGLGLAIVKHVLLRHDASLDIESTLGKGSSFSCRFPASRIA